MARHDIDPVLQVSERLWRISLEAVDGWALLSGSGDGESVKGPFARLLGNS
jgi:hypothetical protein